VTADAGVGMCGGGQTLERKCELGHPWVCTGRQVTGQSGIALWQSDATTLPSLGGVSTGDSVISCSWELELRSLKLSNLLKLESVCVRVCVCVVRGGLACWIGCLTEGDSWTRPGRRGRPRESRPIATCITLLKWFPCLKK
jgi:hypothetical protein